MTTIGQARKKAKGKKTIYSYTNKKGKAVKHRAFKKKR